MKDNEFQCAKCHRVFEKGWSDEERIKEQIENGWGDLKEEEQAIVCDDCYKDFMIWYKKLNIQ